MEIFYSGGGGGVIIRARRYGGCRGFPRRDGELSRSYDRGMVVGLCSIHSPVREGEREERGAADGREGRREREKGRKGEREGEERERDMREARDGREGERKGGRERKGEGKERGERTDIQTDRQTDRDHHCHVAALALQPTPSQDSAPQWRPDTQPL